MEQVFDIKEINSDIYLLGRDGKNNKFCKKVPKPYYPYESYFYIKQDKIDRLRQLSCEVKVEDTDKLSLYGDKLKKVFYKRQNSNEFYEFRDFIQINSDVVFEGDVFLRNLYSLDFLNKDDKVGFEPNVKIIYLDIETEYSTGEIKYDNPTDKILCITLYDNYTKKYHYFYWGEEEIKTDDAVYRYDNERDMLVGLMNKLIELNFDVVTGWHVHFDISYLLNRYKKITGDIYLIKKLSPVGYYKYNDKYKQYSIFGVVIFDLLKGYMRVHRLGAPSYKLDRVAEDELNERKVEVNIRLLNKLPKKELYEYNKKDVELCVRLDEKLHIFEFHNSIRKFVGCPFDSIEYASSIIDFLLLKKARELNIVLPTKIEGGKRKKFEGAFVEAIPGCYKDVIGFDLKALYPSIIKTFNLSKETIMDDGEIKLKGINITKKKKGIIPQIIDDLLVLRYDYDKKRDEYPFEHPNHEKYDILVEAVKCVIDAVYGVNAYPGFRLFRSEIAENITYLGREIIKHTKEFLEERGYINIIIDTDSNLFPSKNSDIDYIIKEGEDILKEMNEEYPRWVKDRFNVDECYLKNAFKKIYKKMIISAKKRYCGKVIWTKGHFSDGSIPEIVGHEYKRSDYSDWARRFQYNLIKKLLDNENETMIKGYIMKKYQEMKNIPPSQIAIPTKIEKELDEYTTNLPKIRGAKYSGKILDMKFGKGDKPLLLFTKGESDIILFFEESEAQKLLEKVNINWEKMSERNIFMIIESLLKNNKMSTLLNEIKQEVSNQKTLLSFFKFDER